MSLLLAIDRNSEQPVWRQIVGGVERLVDDGTLVPGSRLPPTRRLATKLGVNRSTVCRAYQDLWASGYLEARPGSYCTVRERTKRVAPHERRSARVVQWGAASSPGAADAHEAWRRLPSRVTDGRLVDFYSLSMDHGLCPADDFRRAVRRVLLDSARALLDYGDPAGHQPLREAIAQRLRVHGVEATADEVLITSGSQQALDLVVRLLARAGSSAAVESPTYGFLLPILRVNGLGVREVPMKDDGLDLDLFERVAAQDRPAFVYTMPNFQNPTGITTSQAHRERLLAICERHAIPIVEDGFEEELKYTGKAILPIKSMDHHGVVIYVGTFSKVLFPGARIGWVAADRECVERLLAIKRFVSLSGENLSQAALASFCSYGSYEAHLRRAHTVYRRRMQAILRGLDEHVGPEVATWTRPVGGYTLWLQVKGGAPADEARLLAIAADEGVAVVGGSQFYARTPPGLFLRLSICRAPEERIAEGCIRLARAIRRVRGE